MPSLIALASRPIAGGSTRARSAPRPIDWIRLCSFLALFSLVACGGQGCNGCALTPIKGGFAVDKRQENAIELRITQGFFTFFEQNAGPLVNQFLPGGKIAVPSMCTGDTQICCGQMCNIDLNFSSLKFNPQPPATTQMVIRTQLKTDQDFKFKVKQGILNLSCSMAFDTTRSGKPDVGIVAALVATANPATKLTSVNVDPNSIDILDIDDGDIQIKGDVFCDIANLLKGVLIKTLKDQLKKQIAGPLDKAFCQKCMTNDDCSSLANQGCSAQKFCTRDGACLEHLGVEGRLDLGSLLGALSGSKPSPLDIYAVAGGYAQVEGNGLGGLSLGMLGGATVAQRSSCVPDRPPPQALPPPKAAAFLSGTAPNGKPYDVGAGISTLELNLLGHGFYDTGGLCLSLGTAQVPLLSSGTFSVLVQSLGDLTRGQASSLSLVLRPQQPPTFSLGKGTYKTDNMGNKTLDDPLLTVSVKDFAIDFYLYMDERYVRFMRLTADVKLPLGLDVDGKGQIVPIIGDLGQAFQNLRVTNSALLKETPETLSTLFPKLLPLLLGQIGSAIKPIALPAIMNFALTPVQITSADGEAGKLQFLGLFLGLSVVKGMAGQTAVKDSDGDAVETSADLLALEVPPASALQVTATRQKAVRAVLRLSGQRRGGGAMEWQIAVDGGMWRPFDDRRDVTLEEPVLSLPGLHTIDVRGRVQGLPETLDATPTRVQFWVQPAEDRAAALLSVGPASQERVAAGGCSAAGAPSSQGTGSGMFAILLSILAWLGSRRAFGGARRAGGMAVVCCGLFALGAGCAGGDDMNAGGQANSYGKDDEIGRYQSAMVSGDTLYISAYNSSWGDLAYAEVKDTQAGITWQVVDGLPDGPPSDTSAGAVRRGYTDPGPDVGHFTSLSLSSKGVPLIAYQDVTHQAVKLAIGPNPGWTTSVVDMTDGQGGKAAQFGMFAQLALSSNDVPTVSYLVSGVAKDGKIVSQLIVATAKSGQPAGPGDWDKKVVEEEPISCAGFCGSGQACVPAAGSKDPLMAACKPVETGCAQSCTKDQACMGKACVAVLTASANDIPQGTGLYAKLLPDAGGQLVFYNRAKGALKLATGPAWSVMTVSGGDGKSDVGQQVGAKMGPDGTLHLAYADGAMSQLFYRTVMGGTPVAVESVDNGARTTADGSEQHLIGAGAVIFLDSDGPKIAYQDQTSGTLELATRGMGWMHETKGPGAMKSGGFYPQAVQLGGKWILLDVAYDHSGDAPLSSVEFTPL